MKSVARKSGQREGTSPPETHVTGTYEKRVGAPEVDVLGEARRTEIFSKRCRLEKREEK